MKRRPITDRLQDRLWSILAEREALEMPPGADKAGIGGSISGGMAWPQACAAFADGAIPSARFRRLRAVMEVVETLGPCDGRHHARLIRAAGHAEWLEQPEFVALGSWGDPMAWPGFLLETPQALAPTSLRYLSHALWLRGEGLVGENSHVAEIGVGYGGLVAMNALVSRASTTLVDLPNVERAAMKMLAENGLSQAAENHTAFDCVISNYAFTELSSDLQDALIDRYLARASHGMILSNAGVYASKIGGRSDEILCSKLKERGIDASICHDHPLFSPADHSCGCALISW